MAHKPWRARAAEAVLEGEAPSKALFREAAERELAAAEPLRDNGFKIELAKRVIADALAKLALSEEVA